MSGSAKGFVLAVLLVVGLDAQAARIQFLEGEKASLKTQVLVGRDQGLPSVEVTFSLPNLDIEKDADGFDALMASGLNRSQVTGNPEVLSTGTLIAVPPGFVPTLEVVDHNEKVLKAVRVRPAQKKYRCAGNRMEFAFNRALYQSDLVYPAAPASLEFVGNMGEVAIYRVGVQATRMQMRSEDLLVTTRLKARVNFESTNRARKVSLPTSLYRTLQASTENVSSLGQWVRESAQPEVMWVMVADSLKADIGSFVAWKQAKGIQVEVRTLTDMGGTKEAMQTKIKELYTAAAVKPSYFMFVGNKDTMPAFKESTSSGAAASDYRMALLVGDDGIPDVLYGRFLADNAAELAAQVNRAIAFEKAPQLADWYHDATTIASDEGSGPSDEDYAKMVQDALKAGTYKTTDSFFAGAMTATSSNISTALASGRSWIAYFGHGSGTSWGSTNDTFNNGTVSSLSNGGKLPVIVDVACLNSSWVNLSKPFGKAWVTHQKDGAEAGAVAFYGGSVSISWDPPAVMSVGVAKAHFEKHLEGLGASLAAGQLHLIAQMGTGNDTMDNLKWYNLFGDISMLMRTDSTKALQVRHQVEVVEGHPQVTLEAFDAAGAPAAGLLMSVTQQDRGSLGIQKTDASGKATLALTSLAALESGTSLTVTGYNTTTYEATLK